MMKSLLWCVVLVLMLAAPAEAITPIEINVKDYGAVCNGAVDDSVALQAAFNAADATDAEAIVLLPPTTCVFYTPLIIGNRPSGGAYSHVSIRGVSEDLSWLNYRGPNNQAAFQVRHTAYFTMEKFSVFRQASNRGTSIGILLDCSTVVCGSGTQTLTGTFSHMGVSGFAVGLQIGTLQAAASEITCHRCIFSWNDTGVVTLNQNTLNVYFTAVGLVNNGCGMNLIADSVTVYGGDSAGNTIADFCGPGFGQLIIEDFRSELADNVKMIGPTTSINTLHIRNSMLTHQDTSDVLIQLERPFSAILENNQIQGRVQVVAGQVGSDVIMRGNRVYSSPPLGPIAASANVGSIRLVLENNRNYGAARTMGTDRYPDFWGIVSFNQTSPLMEMRADVTEPGGNLDLRAVRGLAYGSPAVRGENLRDLVQFNSSGVTTFTFVRSVPVNTVAGSTQISFASGALTKADIGKKIQIPDVLTDCTPGSDDDLYARIKTIDTPTTASLLPGIWAGYGRGACRQDGPHQSETQTAIIGVAEPDANYLIVGLACDRSETFWVTSVAATGFTLASSNPASTATCHFMVVR